MKQNAEDNFVPDIFQDESLQKAEVIIGNHTISLLSHSAHGQHILSIEAGVIWPGGHFLAEFIYKNTSFFADKKIIELGSGTGLCGILLGIIGSRVLMTDYDELSLSLLNQNIDINSTSGYKFMPQVKQLTWGECPPDICEQYDLIVGSDIVYKKEAVRPLLQSVKQLLSKNSQSEFILANQVSRFSSCHDNFFSVLAELGLDYQMETDQTKKCHLFHIKIRT
eukprot:TRINITY_DN4148_c0_g1_i1.p1 TRINITY_DN4148_c0_g1~~TRINITY_DN4148_c0_g1_i1.p1  ORF type:complete len:234 (-),score=37.05 TRINITY_DN4148_c0_g1_i1:221-889(-)